MTRRQLLPNLLILVADEMRGDVISNSMVKIPNIRSIGKDGVTFTNNFSVNPVCGPARCCMFTGQYPHNGGHRSLFQFLKPYEENLFQFLKRKGYHVHWIGRNDFLSKQAISKSVNRRIDPIRYIVLRNTIKIIRKFLRKPFRSQISLLKGILKEIVKIRIKKLYNPLESPLIKRIIKPYYKLNPYPSDHPLKKSFYFGERTKDQAYDMSFCHAPD
ncbi:MAG: sulfatase-like hydrolase/transferase [Promethearchaeia archaeon]